MFGASALAQQTQQNSNTAAPQQRGAQMRRMMMRRRAMRGEMRGFSQLNLTDQQRQQMRSIMQAQGQGSQAQRQEMSQLMEKRRAGTLTAQDETRAKELRQQLMQSRQGERTQMMNILTPDQKAKMEEMIKTRRANHEKLNQRKRPLL
jgi:Spy/CpxP family protein refolding chaperone